MLYDVLVTMHGGMVGFVVGGRLLWHDDGPSSFRRFLSASMGVLLSHCV